MDTPVLPPRPQLAQKNNSDFGELQRRGNFASINAPVPGTLEIRCESHELAEVGVFVELWRENARLARDGHSVFDDVQELAVL